MAAVVFEKSSRSGFCVIRHTFPQIETEKPGGIFGVKICWSHGYAFVLRWQLTRRVCGAIVTLESCGCHGALGLFALSAATGFPGFRGRTKKSITSNDTPQAKQADQRVHEGRRSRIARLLLLGDPSSCSACSPTLQSSRQRPPALSPKTR
jgi:hypothetical protein